MTMQRVIAIGCMNCNETQEAIVYDSINVSLDPQLKEKLFRGEINIFQCKNCKEKIFIPIPLLYNDMERHILVWYLPFGYLEDDEFLLQFSKEGEWNSTMNKTLPKKLQKLYGKVHFVFDMEELLRYVIFRERLAERWGS